MRLNANARPIVLGLLAALVLAAPTPARAGRLSWLDDVVRRVVREAEAGTEAAARGAKAPGRLFAREADENLSVLARRADDLARSAHRLDEPAEAALDLRFSRMVGRDAEFGRTFARLAPAEKRLVVEMGEAAGRLARRYPGQAEPLIRKLGTEGLSAVRVYGDDVAEVIAKEGPESVNVLRKTGRPGWKFYTETVLRNKKKLAAAGVLALFLADPDRFVDSAGRVTEYAVDQFARAGIQLAGAITGGATKGLESAIGKTLAAYGLNTELTRKAGMVGAAFVAFLAVMVLLGLPIGWAFRPFTWPLRLVLRRGRRQVA